MIRLIRAFTTVVFAREYISASNVITVYADASRCFPSNENILRDLCYGQYFSLLGKFNYPTRACACAMRAEISSKKFEGRTERILEGCGRSVAEKSGENSLKAKTEFSVAPNRLVKGREINCQESGDVRMPASNHENNVDSRLSQSTSETYLSARCALLFLAYDET